jgi:hypothetical protein
MMRAELVEVVEAEHRALRQAQATFDRLWAYGQEHDVRVTVPRRTDASDRQLSGIGFYQILGYSLLFIGCVLALRALVLVFRRSWSP